VPRYFLADEPLLFEGLIAPLGTFAGGFTLAAGLPPVYPPRFEVPEEARLDLVTTHLLLIQIIDRLDDLQPGDLACRHIDRISERLFKDSVVGIELPCLLEQQVRGMGIPAGVRIVGKQARQPCSVSRANADVDRGPVREQVVPCPGSRRTSECESK